MAQQQQSVDFEARQEAWHIVEEGSTPPSTWTREVGRFLHSQPLGAVGGLIIFGMVVLAMLAPVVAPYDPYELRVDHLFEPPGTTFYLGTDDYGRDVYSRLIYGSRISLYVGMLAVALGTTTGAFLGLISGFLGGRVDTVIQRIMDSLLAFPALILALAIVAALGQSTTNVIIAVGVVLMPTAARVIRASVLSLKENVFVEAGRAIGCGNLRILLRHIMPNCVAPYIILATSTLGTAILSEAALSFLGLGTPPPEPSWGTMLSGAAQQYVWRAPWMAIFPGIAISLAVFGFNLFGDALRDVLDPKLRGSR
ncbi:MAG TPA: ABC transporter permease [Alphaproteobacteria bacterium]|nr:ABC transporter permease [Alphaproteobacteria bacterium]